MSNVLIGIIGVILFIGLALAGALFLGPRFQEATLNSKASAMAQSVHQLASAANLYEVQEGRTLTSANAGAVTNALVSAGYLKSPPVNPVASWTFDGNNDTGTYSGRVTVVHAGMPLNDTNARICAILARQGGLTLGSDGSPPAQATLPSTKFGCFRANGYVDDVYLAYERI
jgi:hypothetical protein